MAAAAEDAEAGTGRAAGAALRAVQGDGGQGDEQRCKKGEKGNVAKKRDRGGRTDETLAAQRSAISEGGARGAAGGDGVSDGMDARGRRRPRTGQQRDNEADPATRGTRRRHRHRRGARARTPPEGGAGRVRLERCDRRREAAGGEAGANSHNRTRHAGRFREMLTRGRSRRPPSGAVPTASIRRTPPGTL